MALGTFFPIFVAELLGTFFFLTTILTTGSAIPIGVALAAAITFGGFISSAHFNPAVSVMMLAKGDISLGEFPIYLVAQIAGGLLALAWFHLKPIPTSSTKV